MVAFGMDVPNMGQFRSRTGTTGLRSLSAIERDEEDRKALEAEGWTVVRIWEHEVDEKLPQAAEKVAEAVHSRREEG